MSTIEGTSVRAITIDGRLRVPANIDSLQKFREWVHAEYFLLTRRRNPLGAFTYKLMQR